MSKKVEKTSRRRDDAAASAPIVTGLRERVEARAYELYLERGRFRGHELGDWLEAERLVALELERERGAEPGQVSSRGSRPGTRKVPGRAVR